HSRIYRCFIIHSSKFSRTDRKDHGVEIYSAASCFKRFAIGIGIDNDIVRFCTQQTEVDSGHAVVDPVRETKPCSKAGYIVLDVIHSVNASHGKEPDPYTNGAYLVRGDL